MSARYDRLLRIADRLGRANDGSAEADAAIYEALRLTRPVLPYTTDEEAARTLLPQASGGCSSCIPPDGFTRRANKSVLMRKGCPVPIMGNEGQPPLWQCVGLRYKYG